MVLFYLAVVAVTSLVLSLVLGFISTKLKPESTAEAHVLFASVATFIGSVMTHVVLCFLTILAAFPPK